MKLPKGFGSMGALMKQAQEAMERAKNIEEELAVEEVEVEKGGVKVRFNGAGEILSLKIDASLAGQEDMEALEDALVLAVREGHGKAAELRRQKLSEVTGGLPIPPGMNPF